jgi:hypothetical protein
VWGGDDPRVQNPVRLKTHDSLAIFALGPRLAFAFAGDAGPGEAAVDVGGACSRYGWRARAGTAADQRGQQEGGRKANHSDSKEHNEFIRNTQFTICFFCFSQGI